MHFRCLKRRTHEVPRRRAVRGKDVPMATRRRQDLGPRGPEPLLAALDAAALADGTDRRHASADRREAAVTLREAAVDQRERAVQATMSRARLKAERSALEAAATRDVNEQLVLTAVDDQARLAEAERQTLQLRYLAEHDALTALPNRTVLAVRLDTAMAEAVAAGAKVALMYMDIDHFKEVNDTYGYGVGDQVLQSVARIIQAAVRHSDTVCRQGGDEFLVLLPQLEEVEDCAIIARKLKHAMARPQIVGDLRIRVTLSIGICLFPDLAADGETLQSNADAALYEAKQAGRNTFRIYVPVPGD